MTDKPSPALAYLSTNDHQLVIYDPSLSKLHLPQPRYPDRIVVIFYRGRVVAISNTTRNNRCQTYNRSFCGITSWCEDRP
jgi:hypothetical protein